MHEQNGEPPRTCLGFKSMKAQTGDSEDDILANEQKRGKNEDKGTSHGDRPSMWRKEGADIPKNRSGEVHIAILILSDKDYHRLDMSRGEVRHNLAWCFWRAYAQTTLVKLR